MTPFACHAAKEQTRKCKIIVSNIITIIIIITMTILLLLLHVVWGVCNTANLRATFVSLHVCCVCQPVYLCCPEQQSAKVKRLQKRTALPPAGEFCCMLPAKIKGGCAYDHTKTAMHGSVSTILLLNHFTAPARILCRNTPTTAKSPACASDCWTSLFLLSERRSSHL